MDSIVEQTRQEIKRDAIVQEALARGIVNKKALASWLKQHRGVDGSLDTIAKSIARWQPRNQDARDQEAAWRLLEQAYVNEYGPATGLVFQEAPRLRERIATLYREIPLWEQELLLTVPSERTVSVLFEPEHRSLVERTLGADHIQRTHEGLYALSVALHDPPEGSGPGLASLLELLAPALRGVSIEVPFVANSASELFLFVHRRDHADAYQLLMDLSALAQGSAPGTHPDP